MGSYSLLEEVWEKPLVENPDLLVNQRQRSYANSQGVSDSPFQSVPPNPGYSDMPRQYHPSTEHNIVRTQNTFASPGHLQSATPTLANVSPERPMQHIDGNRMHVITRVDQDATHLDRIRALEEQITRLESALNTKKPSMVGEMTSNNDLLMYIATGAFFIFVMDNIAKMSKK